MKLGCGLFALLAAVAVAENGLAEPPAELAKLFASSILPSLVPPNAGIVNLTKKTATGATGNDKRTEEEDSDCLSCVCQSAASVMTFADRAVARWCDAKPQGPTIGHFCHLREEVPEVAAGFLAYMARPVTDGFSFCAGRGRCGVEKSAWIVFEPELAILDQCEQTKNWLASSTATQQKTRQQNRAAPPPMPLPLMTAKNLSSAHHLTLNGPTSPFAGVEDDCRNCVKIVVRHVMRFINKELDGKCGTLDPKSPNYEVWRHVCRMHERNPELTEGWLVGFSRPIEYAFGYCSGAQVCKPPTSTEEFKLNKAGLLEALNAELLDVGAESIKPENIVGAESIVSQLDVNAVVGAESIVSQLDVNAVVGADSIVSQLLGVNGVVGADSIVSQLLDVNAVVGSAQRAEKNSEAERQSNVLRGYVSLQQ